MLCGGGASSYLMFSDSVLCYFKPDAHLQHTACQHRHCDLEIAKMRTFLTFRAEAHSLLFCEADERKASTASAVPSPTNTLWPSSYCAISFQSTCPAAGLT
jgi:hypothetical protein